MTFREREDRADMEVKMGRFRDFSSIQELLVDLHSPLFVCPICGLVYYPVSATSTCACVGNK